MADVEYLLVNGWTTLVDEEDLPILRQRRWYAAYQHGRGPYVQVSTKGGAGSLSLQRVLTSAPPRTEVDHIDRNTMNNTRRNLRVVDHAINQWNRDMVSVRRAGSKWQARIMVRGKRISLGAFLDRDDAVAAYRKAEAVMRVA